MSSPNEIARPRHRQTATLLALAFLWMPAPAMAQTSMNGDADGFSPYEGLAVIDIDIDTPVESLREVSREAITLRIGSTYHIDDVRRSLQNIFALGGVSDVQVRALEAPEGLHLTFVVLPAARLREIGFAGDSPIGLGPLRDALRIRAGDELTTAVVEQQSRRLELAFSDRGYSTARVEPELAFATSGDHANLVFHLTPGNPTRLRELILLGNTGVTTEAALNVLGLRQGGVFGNLRLVEGIAALRRYLAEQHYFHADIRVEGQAINQAANTVDVSLRADAGPQVDLRFNGLDRSEEDIHELLPIWSEASVADWVLKESRRRLIADFQERGHFRPLIIYHRERDALNRNIVITFSIIAGPKAKIVSLEFEGNENVSEEQIRATIGSRERGLVRGGTFLTRQWEADHNAVLALYRRHGFNNARIVEAPVTRDPEIGGLRLLMRIEEGERALVSRASIEVDSDTPLPGIDPLTWAGELRLKAGAPYHEVAVRDDENRLRILLANAGYPRSRVTSERNEDPAGTGYAISYRLMPGERVRVSRILISGNQTVKDEVIRREMAIVPGSPYTYEGIVESQSRLYQLGLFSRVEIEPAQPDSIEPERAVVVRVEEGSHTRLGWGLGYDTEEKLRGTFTLGNNNLGGMNREGSISVRASVRELRASTLINTPYTLGRRVESTFSVWFESVEETSFDVERYGASYQLLKRHSRELTSIGRYSFRRVKTFNIQIDPAGLEPKDQSVVIGSLTYSLLRDTRPNPIEPRIGSYNTLDAGVAAEALGSESDFVKLFGRSYWYWDLGKGAVFALAGRAGLMIPFAGDDIVPLAERFFAGGSTTLRAFELNTAGPTDDEGNPLGGEVLLIGNAELRFPVRGNLGGVIFFDVGNVFFKPETVSIDEVREVVGIGARYTTPIGPVRVDWGHLLDRRADESGSRFYVSVGHTF